MLTEARVESFLSRVLGAPEVIGDEECPVLLRWMLLRLIKRDVTLPDGTKSTHSHKVMLHRFLPYSKDRDPHDHPWPFMTIVLSGVYYNYELCNCTRRYGEHDPDCGNCVDGYILDVMRRGTVRYRSAQHAHITQTKAEGAWTIVITGKAARSWGFIVGRAWWPWKMYTSAYGTGMVCDDGESASK